MHEQEIEAALRTFVEAEHAAARAEAVAARVLKRLDDGERKRRWQQLVYTIRGCRTILGKTVGIVLAESAGIEMKGVVVTEPATPAKS